MPIELDHTIVPSHHKGRLNAAGIKYRSCGRQPADAG